MKIESLALGDVEETKELIRDSFLESVAPSWSENAIYIFLNSDLETEKLGSYIANGYVCLKAKDEIGICGVLLFSSDSKLAHLFVKPSAYRQGVAKSLFSAAKHLLSDSVECIHLTSTEFAVPAYERLGFRKSSKPFRYNGCLFQPMVYWMGNDRLASKVEFIS